MLGALGCLVALLLLVLATYIYGYINAPTVLAREQARQARRPQYGSVSHESTAILIACYKGEVTIASTVMAALKTGCPVYVVIDGPGDNSATLAEEAGAFVLELPVNGGKPAALKKAYDHFQLSELYRTIAILDDDVTVEPQFIQWALQKFKPSTAIVVGKNITLWPKEHRWNAWLASRAYSYWTYQLVTRRVQSWFNVMNCISGSNSVYRTELLDIVLARPVRYIVDDTQWVLDTHRLGLGRVVYAPRARALLQDPTTYHDWYKQNLRWLKGTFQGVIGHKIGRRMTWFDYAYSVLILQWLLYVLSGPMAFVAIWWAWEKNPLYILGVFIGYILWGLVASIALRRVELLLLMPAIVAIDFIYRWIFVQALYEAWKEPTVEECRWESPARIALSPEKR